VKSLARGRRVLDLFAYEGAFALACSKGGAKRVTAVDLDEAAVARGRANADLNRAKIDFRHADAFEVLRAKVDADLVLLDPPRWISGRDDEEAGRRRYLDLNALAVAALPRGGLLATSSCSGRLSEEGFLGILRQAAHRASRDLRILAVRGAAPDHPLAANFPEGRYLKFVLAEVR
jgi:23S rRNA (cytosine1962-C5)-methyltransferase